MGSNGSKQKKAQAIGEFSSSYQRNRAEHDQNTETPRNEEPRREKPEPKKLKREEPKKEQPKRDPELIVMSNTKKERKHVREKPKMETVQADPSVDIDFTNTSNETVYVFITEKGLLFQCRFNPNRLIITYEKSNLKTFGFFFSCFLSYVVVFCFLVIQCSIKFSGQNK